MSCKTPVILGSSSPALARAASTGAALASLIVIDITPAPKAVAERNSTAALRPAHRSPQAPQEEQERGEGEHLQGECRLRSRTSDRPGCHQQDCVHDSCCGAQSLRELSGHTALPFAVMLCGPFELLVGESRY